MTTVSYKIVESKGETNITWIKWYASIVDNGNVVSKWGIAELENSNIALGTSENELIAIVKDYLGSMQVSNIENTLIAELSMIESNVSSSEAQ